MNFSLNILLRDLLICVIICYCNKWLPQHKALGYVEEIYSKKRHLGGVGEFEKYNRLSREI